MLRVHRPPRIASAHARPALVFGQVCSGSLRFARSATILKRQCKASGYPESYYAATAQLPRLSPVAAGKIRCEICVVGGGYTGLSAAYHLARAGHDVVLLESQRIGWGASGRNGGQIHSGQRRDIDFLERLYGRDDAIKLWRLGEDAKALLRGLANAHKIDCELKPGLIHGDHRARLVPETRRYVEKLRDVYGYEDISFLDRDEVRRHIATQDYHGGFLDRGAGHFHPLKFALGLARIASDAGARLFERSPVTRITRGEPARIETAQAQIEARFVFLACNAYFDGIAPEIEARLVPINNFILATEPLGADRARELIRDDVAVSDSRRIVNYYRLSADKRLLFGSGESYFAFGEEKSERVVRRAMLRVFPQLRDIRVDYIWSGKVAVTLRRLPYFRRLAPNMLVAAGYSGHGVALATLGGQILAEAVSGTVARFDLLARLDVPPFPGGRLLRGPLMATGMLWYALRDRL